MQERSRQSRAKMSDEMIETSRDGFLGGRVQLHQPIKGHRSGTDAVLLAASVPLHVPPYDRAQIGHACLELGCGVGVASLCLAARMAAEKLDYQITGVDIQADLIALAQANATTNQIEAQFIVQDMRAPISHWSLASGSFAHIFANPPFYTAGTSAKPPDKAKQTAHIGEPETLALWVRRACALVKPKGSVTFIHRAAAMADLVACMRACLGGLQILPISAHAGEAAKRVLIRGTAGSQADTQILPPLILHRADGGYMAEVENILRHGGALDLTT